MSSIIIYHDDQADEILDKINQVLEVHNLKFEDVSLEGDDFVEYKLEEL